MSEGRLTREKIKVWRMMANQPGTDYGKLLDVRHHIGELCDLALQSLSQEAVRDEALEEAARVADALSSKWHTDYKIGHGPYRASAHREGMSDGAEEVARELRALKREPNAAEAPPAAEAEGRKS